MKACLLVLIFSLCTIAVNGQNTIQGCILSSDSSVVINAKIDLIQTSDNVMVNSTFSDQSGNYTFKNVAQGTYLIQASYFESTPTQKK